MHFDTWAEMQAAGYVPGHAQFGLKKGREEWKAGKTPDIVALLGCAHDKGFRDYYCGCTYGCDACGKDIACIACGTAWEKKDPVPPPMFHLVRRDLLPAQSA